jgi:hypothetical protein
LEGGEEETNWRRRDAGERSKPSKSQKMKDRANATGTTNHEFTLARNEFNNTGVSDEK